MAGFSIQGMCTVKGFDIYRILAFQKVCSHLGYQQLGVRLSISPHYHQSQGCTLFLLFVNL